MLEPMIAELEGIYKGSAEQTITLEVGGMGLEVWVPSPILATMPREGEKVKLHTYLHVREDELTLYGFLTREEKQFFLALLSVSNVGPKLALRIMGAPMAQVKRAIAVGDEKLLPPIKGVGPKVRKALVNALQDKVAADLSLAKLQAVPANEPALAALEQLGYSRLEAHQALNRVPENVKSTEERIRQALKFI